MALTRSIGVALETAGTGTNPIDVRKGLGGLFIRAGILAGSSSPLVLGIGEWAYALAVGTWVTQTATGDGVHLWGNDGGVLVGTSGVGGTVPAAPGAGLSRIDIIWIRHPSNGENGDTTSAPAAGVTCGTAASYPNAPALPAGAFELARNTMTSAATTTASAGNTITQTAPYTAPQGGVVLCRNTTERNALTSLATAANPITIDLLGVRYVCNDATNWRRITPFATCEAAVTAAANGTFSVTWPTGLFTVAPSIQATPVNPTTSLATILTRSATGCTGYVMYYSGGTWSPGAIPVMLTATQALSTAAAG